MMQAILECKNLTKKFGRKTALDDVSLQLKSGKIYGLLGENGSGKTTWMKLIAGLSKPEKGEIFYEGHPLCAKDKESIAYMATENFFYSYMKIKDVEKYYTDFFAGFDRAAFWNLIGKTGLDGEMKVRELSSGMNAKLRIAATLARKAKLTLLDEPLNGVDFKAREQIVEMILRQAGGKKMVKLLKYEMKKQQTSRMVIGSILLVCVLGFALGMLLGREKLAAVSLAVMMLATFFVVFYVGIESILVLNRDLKTKQSYMLWMIPKSIWEILGSKFLAAILQMLIVFVMYVAVGLICILVTLQHTGHLSDLFKMIWQAGELYIDGLPSIIWGFAEIFLGWTVVIMAGFVGVILSRTLLLNAKYSGFLAVVVFFAIIIAVEKIYDLICPAICVNIGTSGFNPGFVLYYLVVGFILFGVSGWMADKKLSV